MAKVALVTGYSSGLGTLVVQYLTARNWFVYAASNDNATSERHHKNSKLVKLDVTSDDECKRVVDTIVADTGRIDAVVNIAGLTLVGPTLEFSTDNFKNIFDVNTLGVFRLAKYAHAHMKSQKGGGRIVNITSLNGLVSMPSFGLYCASKFALEALGVALSYELKRDHVYVTNIAPGAISGSGTRKSAHRGIREKSFIISKLLPMISVNQVASSICDVLESEKPQTRILLGRDAKISVMLYKYLPTRVWDFIVTHLIDIQ